MAEVLDAWFKDGLYLTFKGLKPNVIEFSRKDDEVCILPLRD